MGEIVKVLWERVIDPLWSLLISFWTGESKFMTYFGRSKLRLLNFILVIALMVLSFVLFLEVQDMADEIERLRALSGG